ncbi:MAG TPA: TRAP transporter small permease [Syntrophorhabdaceae bacterium]|nr:TRAP transporter small permease [Syntrophorhabdaceae bacterium]
MTIRNKILATIGSLLIFLIMILLVIEVISRFVFGASIEGVIEIVGIFLALSVFAGFSPCEEGRQHVSAQLVIQRLSARTARIVKIFVYILAVITVAVMSWQTVLNFYDSYSIREALPGASFQMPVYWAKAGVFIGFIMFLIQLIVSLIRLLEKSKIITTEKKN